jgi:hypothetical protein
MKPSTCLPAATAAAAAIAALVLTGAPAMASTGTSTTHATQASASQLLTAWSNGPGWADLNAVDNALIHRNGRALAHYTTLAIAHPQPVDTAGYVATMRVYHAAGIAMAQGKNATAHADIAKGDDMAWDVVQDTFSAINRLPIS